MGKNKIKIGVLLSYIYMVLHIIIGLIYTPIMIRLLGQSEYGLYNTVSSTISTMYILNFGIGSSYIRFYSQFKKREEKRKIDQLNGMFMLIFLVLGSIAALCGMFLTGNLHFIFDSGLTMDEYSRAKILMFFLVFSLSVSFPMGVFESYIIAHEEFVFQKIVILLQTILNPIMTLPLLILGYGSIGVVAISIILTIGVWTANAIFSIKKLKMRFVFKELDLKSFKNIFILIP